MHQVMVAVAHGARGDARRIEAGVRLRHRERHLALASDEGGQPAGFLLAIGMRDDGARPEYVHVYARCGRHRAAGSGDGFHHEGRLRNAEPRSAVLLRQGDAEPAARGDRPVEGVRKFAVPVP